ncbi:MAG: hypothetical protein NWE75_00475 [Candidatus Bathyarchaeota archaeon]|nr:hypothetical protein [Candidatus Bathyarchaeota archaeon]
MSRRRGLMSSKAAKDDVVAFFENLYSRRFSEAEKAIEAVRERRFGNNEFKEGYVKALEGLLLSCKSGDERDFLNRAPFDSRSMKRYRKQFRDFLKKGIHSPFDIGYFMAWSDLVQYRLENEKGS